MGTKKGQRRKTARRAYRMEKPTKHFIDDKEVTKTRWENAYNEAAMLHWDDFQKTVKRFTRRFLRK